MRKINNLSDYTGGAKCIKHGIRGGISVISFVADIIGGAYLECWNGTHKE